MKTKAIITASAAILLIGGALAAARAHSIHHGMGFHHGRGFDRGLAMLAWKLDLTDAQRAQVKAMFNSEWPTVQPLLQQLVTEQDQMIAATSKGTFDEAKVKAIADQQSQAVSQLLVEKERFISQVYNNVLNPEQRTKADAMRQEWEQRINQRLQEHSSAAPSSTK
jgi:Spy/CpxP family protein refolding chaperone